jgi:hypothetical protein
VNVDEVALPFASVVSVSVAIPLANVPPAPDGGAVNITDTPLLGDPPVVTFATSLLANTAPTVVFWPDPPAAMIDMVRSVNCEPPAHPVIKANARQTKAVIVLVKILRLIVTPSEISRRSVAWHRVPSGNLRINAERSSKLGEHLVQKSFHEGSSQ